MRIRGTVGDWPVDLQIDLDERELALLSGQLGSVPSATGVDAPESLPRNAPPDAGDRHWALAQALLRSAGRIEGPELLAQLAALAGGEQAGKRLLVRLRHAPQVRVEQGRETPLYLWIDQ